MKRILITGAKSYIGESIKRYLESEFYVVDIIDTIGLNPTPDMFHGYDVVFNTAGIAHVKETRKNRELYFFVNKKLSVSIAKASKKAGVRQLIVLSSMSVYGLTTGHITKNTIPNPNNVYGESKLQADIEIRKLEDKSFKVACLRPPMVYGKECKGNYQKLREFALKSFIFPDYKNYRSMIYIGNLCEFVKRVIDEELSGMFFPQNSEYVSTYEMVNLIAKTNGKGIITTSVFNPVIKAAPVNIVKKVFGNLTYELVDTVSKYTFAESIELTEGKSGYVI